MKKSMILFAIVISFCFSVSAKITTTNTTVFFETARHELTTETLEALIHLVKEIPIDLDYEIIIGGHTDNRGNLNYNKNLSLNRAKKVQQFLVDNGISQKSITLDYMGELSPIKPNVTDKNMEENRRVEITLRVYRFDNLKELEQALSPNKTSNYVIKPDEETIIEGRKGVKILIKPQTFTYEDGTPVTEDINFELTEALDYNDFVSSGLLTVSKNDLLESGGMVKIDAKTISGKEVVVKEDNPMLIVIPNDNRQDNMEVFISDEGADWTAKGQPITTEISSDFKRPFPVMNSRNIALPEFVVDMSNKPKFPINPKLPRKPAIPREESFERKIRWYQVFDKEEIEAKQEYAFLKAMESYNKRMKKYTSYMASYRASKEVYKIAVEEYKYCLAEWEEQVKIDREFFRKTDEYLAVSKRHEAIYQRNLKKYKEKLVKWRAEKKERMIKAGMDMDKLGITTANAMNNYVFTFNELKWINVDRFYHLKESEKQVITLKDDNEKEDERVLILFKDIGSMLSMSLSRATNEYIRGGFPRNEDAVIFAYKVEDGKPMICYREMDGSSDYQLDYITTSFSEIKEILSQFDGERKS